MPTGPDELTPGFVTQALHAHGALPADSAVASFEFERVGEGVGFIGVIARLRLTYTGDAVGAPRTLIAKFPSPDEGARAVGNLYGLYEREVRFYDDIACDAAGLHIARCYHAAWDAEAGQSLLLLEDLAEHGTLGDQLEGCTEEQAILACGELAKFHARWSDPAKLASVGWLQDGAEIVRAAMEQVYAQSWQPFLELYGSRLAPSVAAVVPDLNVRIMRIVDEQLTDRPMQIAHGDFRLDNMFFGREGGPYRLACIDWQSPNRAWGAYDIAYFLSGSLPPEKRASCERDILRAYHETIVAGGVRDYSFEQLFDDYRLSLLVYLAIFVVNGAMLELSNQRAVNLFEAIFYRLNAAIVDLDAVALLP